VSFQRPIFNKGLFGRANASVCNLWTDASETVAQNADGIAWATGQLVRGKIEEAWLAKLLTATLIAPNRWKYTFEPFLINNAGSNAVPQALEPGTFGSTLDAQNHHHAFNLRELRNTAGAIDGSPLNAGTTIGPVGSTWSGSAWSLAGLAGYVHLHLEYDPTGRTLYWFDCPNPFQCDAPAPSPPPGGGE
jgi:hypothetical protein